MLCASVLPGKQENTEIASSPLDAVSLPTDTQNALKLDGWQLSARIATRAARSELPIDDPALTIRPLINTLRCSGQKLTKFVNAPIGVAIF